MSKSTGHKAGLVSVPRSLRMSKNTDGGLVFYASESLMPQQIANFFSHLLAKRVLPTDEVQEDLREAMAGKNLQDHSKEVLNEDSF